MDSADIRDKLAAMGAEPQTGGADELRSLLKSETSTWTKVIKDSNITVQ